MSQKLRARDSKTCHLSPSTIISILEQGYSRLIIILKHHKPPLVGEHQNKGGANHLLQRFDVNSHQERRCQLPMTQSPSSSAANNSIKKKHAIRFHYYLALKIKSQNRTDRQAMELFCYWETLTFVKRKLGMSCSVVKYLLL
jgi:hypothetical protein